MKLARSMIIARPIDEVFAFIADARNDPSWCTKLRSVQQMAGDGPGPGAHYSVVHRPIPLRPVRTMEHTCLDWKPPHRIDWRQDDGTDVLLVTYELEDLGDRTRLTQRDDAELGAPRLMLPFMRLGLGHDIGRQLKALKGLLEDRPDRTRVRA